MFFATFFRRKWRKELAVNEFYCIVDINIESFRPPFSKGGGGGGASSPSETVICASARPADDEAEVEIGKNKEYRKRDTRSRPRRLCF